MKITTNQDMRRYERPHINEVWCGDSSVGPYLKTDDGKKHKVYLIALIDDASRFLVGIDVFFNDNFGNLMAYVNKYNQSVHSSLSGKTPQDRFFSEPERIRLRYSTDMEEIFLLEHDGTLTPIRLLNKQENAFVKREKIHLCRGDE